MTENGTFLYPRYGPLGNFFFSVINQNKLFYNFNTATHGGLKNQNFDFNFNFNFNFNSSAAEEEIAKQFPTERREF
jgi:hypothetical protein